jgi:Flp pilus assembly protein TadG
MRGKAYEGELSVVTRDSKNRLIYFLDVRDKFGWLPSRLCGWGSASPRRSQRIRWKATEAAELVEFALLLPILLVMIIGILDFATAYNLKQKLANAAREGARMGSSQDKQDLSTTNPASIRAVKDDVVTYLQQAGVDTSFIGNTMSYTNTTPFTATFYSSGSYGLKIERTILVTDAGGNTNLATRVTLTYPYDWTYGFNHIIRLLIPSAAISTQIGIETDATMIDL